MKIVVSASGPDIESTVDEKFGRCPYFIVAEIVDKTIVSHKSIENTSTKQMTGAGTTAAQLVADMNVDAIITGNMGPRAFTIFQQLGIAVYEGRGIIKKAVQDFIAGNLRKMESAKCPRHMFS
ncbi:MAG: NifB/NifX family molybdenum-iron cluster-binding protein [Nanoarchaeota archaeon]|nr:NifB/NifX family molybdenum-iron cluster-binding protein [Nanoarchaeota archaeon]